MQVSYPVVVTKDGGYDCWDTTVSAREIARAMNSGMVESDPRHQRGKNSVTGKEVVDWKRVEDWTRALLADEAIFGQLTWNFRPEETGGLRFVGDRLDDGSLSATHGTLVVEDGQAKMPDSRHRHESIRLAVESVAKGSDFDPARRFSLRIWSVPEAFEDKIFYAMNMEHKKADATRSKWLHQTGPGQRLARELVRRSPHLGEDNVEIVSNTVSVRNPRLAAFNTFSAALETADSPWSQLPDGEVDQAAAFLVKFWDKLVQVIPELGRLTLAERQAARGNPARAMASSALGIHGYLRMAYRLYPDGDLEALGALDGDGFFDPHVNQSYRDAGVVVPGSGRNSGKLVARSSHASRRAMGEIFAARCGLA
jgi:hypothetical protein